MQAVNRIEAIHQVLIVDGFGLPEHLPETVEVNTQCARDLHPDATYHLWTGDALREYIRSNFDNEVLTAFDTLTPYSYKCDLARFCLLYASGGIYLDLAVRMMNRWAIPQNCKMAAFTEMYPGMMSWTATQTSLLWSCPRRPEWDYAIRWIVENCRDRFYGPHDHYPTAGPLLGRAIAAAMAAKGQADAADDQWIGECRYVTPERPLQNLCYVAPDKLLVGMRTKLKAGDLTEMGLTGTNNYCQIWRARKVYGETVHVWKADDPLLSVESRAARTATGIAVTAGTVGRVQYGPFVNLDAGQYRLRIDFSEGTRFRRLFVDLSARYGSAVIHEYDYDGGQPGVREFVEFDFTLHDPQDEVEFRVSVFGDFSGELKSFTLRPIDERVWSANDDRIGIILGRRTPDGILIPAGTRGRALYGPYAGVEPGCYSLRIAFSADTVFARLLVEVAAHSGNTVLHAFDHRYGETAARPELQMMFALDRRVADLEFRIEVFGDFAGRLLRYTLSSIDPGEMLPTKLDLEPEDDATAGLTVVQKVGKLGLRKVLGLVADGAALSRWR